MANKRDHTAVAADPHGEEVSTTETTPLLVASTAPIPQNGSEDVNPAAINNKNDELKPLPKTQILLLCYARMIEPIAFFSIFPYINAMVLRNGPSLTEADMGFWSGLIESLFSLTQMSVMLLWGGLADRVGRKPVLVFSLLGVALATSLFGFASTLWQMILFRCLAGVFAGTIVTIRTMMSEHATKETQARAFSWFAVSGNMGIFLGPLLGGALADPAGQFPGAFGGVWFFEAYPYALSSIVVGAVGLTAVVTSALFVEETLPAVHRDANKMVGDDDIAENDVPRPSHSLREIVKAPGVGIVLYNYSHVMLLAFAYTAIVPVFWATSPPLGGLGFLPWQISIFMGETGLAQAIWLLLVFPPLQKRWGTNGLLRACGNAYPFFMGIMPIFNALLRSQTRAGETAFWILAPLLIAIGTGVSMAFTGVQLALNDVSPSPETLGMLNALALTLTSGLRSFSPALFSSLFAIGVKNQVLHGYLIWVILAILASGFTISTRFLPTASEKKPHDDGEAGDEN